jgi:hypothetical protein
MNSNQLQTFDANALKKRISETVQGTFGMLIPQEQFEALVKQHVSEFFEREEFFDVFEVTGSKDLYGRNNDKLKLRKAMTPFKAQVWEHCAHISRVALNEYFERESNVLKDKMMSMFETREFAGTVSNSVAAIASKVQEAQMKAVIYQATKILGTVVGASMGNYGFFEKDVEDQVKQTLGLSR